MAAVTATVDGVEVSSSSGTLEELTAQLTPAPESTSGTTPKEQAVETGSPAQEPTSDPDPASEAGKTLSKRRREMKDALDLATWEKHEARREADKLKAELDSLKQPKTVAATDQDEPDIDAYVARIGSDFQTYEQAQKAFVKDSIQHAFTQRDQASVASTSAHMRQQALAATAAKGKEAHADFDAVIGEFVSQGGRFAPTNAVEANGPLGDLEGVILQHPLGHTVAYEIAKDPELRARLLGASSRVMFMADMGKLLTRLEGAPTGSPPKPAPVSKAKPPVQPAKGQPLATGGPPGDDASDDEHLAYYQQQERASRRRA